MMDISSIFVLGMILAVVLVLVVFGWRRRFD
jgi:hypothetical protein